MTTVGIHQPGYLPWLGFFKKMMNCDILVYLDDVKYVDTGHNKNKIRTSSGFTELTVPVKSHSTSTFKDVQIDNTKNWAEKHKKSIMFSYSKAPHFREFADFLDIYDHKFDLLIDLNIRIIEYLKEKLDLKTKTLFSSSYEIDGQGSDRVLNICKALNADAYISGTVWAETNLRVDDFVKNNIKVIFQNFKYPVYNQCYKPFIEKMAAIDLLFNEGDRSKEILLNAETV